MTRLRPVRAQTGECGRVRALGLAMLAGLLIVAICTGCDREATKADKAGDEEGAGGLVRQEPKVVASDVDRAARPVPILSASTFDLVAHPGGVVLVRAVAPAERGGIRMAEYDDAGHPLRAQRLAAPRAAPIVELAAAADARAVALAWVSSERGASAAHGLVFSHDAQRVPQPVALGPAGAAPAARGRLAVSAVRAAGKSRFMVLLRGRPEPCRDSPGACTGFHLMDLAAGGAESRRVALTVPDPCPGGVAGFSAAAGRLYYGVCARGDDGSPVTTMFTIEYSPEYAQAEPLLSGCRPLGTTTIGDDVLLVADCHGTRRAVRVGHRQAPVVGVDLDAVRLECADARPVLRVEGDHGLYAPLGAATDGLGPLLPEHVAPAGSRAAWTGRALFVATPDRDGLFLKHFACRDGRLNETTISVPSAR